MKKTTKVLAVFLSVLMLLSVIPFTALAAEDDADRLAGWKENYELLLDTIIDDSNYTSWKYVDINKKAINDKMGVYTAFALYDAAWKNYVTKDVDKATAKEILLALIEKAQYNFDDGYVDEIVKVLETASDVNDFIQKVNEYAKIDLFASEGWGTAFQVVNEVIKIANYYQTYRDKFIEAYARVLSVKQANEYYVDLLQYLADKTDDAVLKAAALELIDDINKDVKDVLLELAETIAGDAAQDGLNYLATMAMNSNAYTAVALKVYGIGKSVADVLWNTGDQYKLLCTLKEAYEIQDLTSDWTDAALAEDGDKALVAVSMLLTVRNVSEKALYDLKLAENEGVINKIKNKLYGTVYNDIEINLASLKAIESLLFDTEVADFQKVVRALYVYCPVSLKVLSNGALVTVLADGKEIDFSNDAGKFVSVYSEYSKEYLKVAYLYSAYDVRLTGTADGAVTMIMDVLNADGTVSDWSFTDEKVTEGTTINFATAFEGTPTYTISTAAEAKAFNDEFVESEFPTVTAGEVFDAVVEVGKDTVKETTKKATSGIAEFFKNLFAKIAEAFKNLFKKK